MQITIENFQKLYLNISTWVLPQSPSILTKVYLVKILQQIVENSGDYRTFIKPKEPKTTKQKKTKQKQNKEFKQKSINKMLMFVL